MVCPSLLTLTRYTNAQKINCFEAMAQPNRNNGACDATVSESLGESDRSTVFPARRDRLGLLRPMTRFTLGWQQTNHNITSVNRHSRARPSDSLSSRMMLLIVPIKLASASGVCWATVHVTSNWPRWSYYGLTAKAPSAQKACIVITRTSIFAPVATLCAPSPSCCGPLSSFTYYTAWRRLSRNATLQLQTRVQFGLALPPCAS